MKQEIWWLSFAGEEGFRGVAVVEADDFLTAVKTAHRLGINPGGQVSGTEISDVEYFEEQTMPRNKLLGKEFLAKHGFFSLRERAQQEADRMRAH